MKYLDEYRDDRVARSLVDRISATVTRPWTLMEVCGGQTHTLIRQGIDQVLPSEIELVHGPGCPVCVTPVALIDRAVEIAKLPEAIVCSFGDMLRVPGTAEDLFMARAAGGDVRVVYSPLDALTIARDNPDRTVVFFAVGFETTAPANAMAVRQAHRLGIENFTLLVAHVLVPPAIAAILVSPGNRVQGFLAPGHVCAIKGWREYEPIARDFGVPLVVTGFEPVDLLEGIAMLVRQLEEGRHEVENQYVRAVVRDGNEAAQRVVGEVFETADRAWRGIGVIEKSGLRLRQTYAHHDAEVRFPAAGDAPPASESEICIAGDVLRGRAKPHDCPGVRHAVHARTPARRSDGLERGGVRRVLPGRPASIGEPPRERLARLRPLVPGAPSGGRTAAPRARFGRRAHASPDHRALRTGVRRRGAGAIGRRRRGGASWWRPTRFHDGLVRRPTGVLPRFEHRRAGGERDGQRPRDGRARSRSRCRPR